MTVFTAFYPFIFENFRMGVRFSGKLSAYSTLSAPMSINYLLLKSLPKLHTYKAPAHTDRSRFHATSTQLQNSQRSHEPVVDIRYQGD